MKKKINVLAFSTRFNDDAIFLVCRTKSNLYQAVHHRAPQSQSFSTTKISSTVLSETAASSLCVAVEQ